MGTVLNFPEGGRDGLAMRPVPKALELPAQGRTLEQLKTRLAQHPMSQRHDLDGWTKSFDGAMGYFAGVGVSLWRDNRGYVAMVRWRGTELCVGPYADVEECKREAESVARQVAAEQGKP